MGPRGNRISGPPACAGRLDEMFATSAAGVARAKRICTSGPCPLLAHCLAEAIERDEPHGVWGGTTPPERRAIRRGDNRAAC